MREGEKATIFCVLHGLKAAAGQLHGRVLKLKLGAAIQVEDARAVGWEVANGGDLNGSLVLQPSFRLSLGGRVLLGAVVGGRGLRAGILDHASGLLDSGRLKGIGSSLGSLVGVETLGEERALARGRGEAGAAVDGSSEAGRSVGDLDGWALSLLAGDESLNVGVHGGNARVTLLNNVVCLHALGALHHGGVVEVGNIDAVSLGELLHVVVLHVGAIVGEGSSSVNVMDLATGGSLAGDDAVDGPVHGRLGGAGRFTHVRV